MPSRSGVGTFVLHTEQNAGFVILMKFTVLKQRVYTIGALKIKNLDIISEQTKHEVFNKMRLVRTEFFAYYEAANLTGSLLH